MNFLSLFAGIGGLELGLERAGMTVVGQVEIDPFCQHLVAYTPGIDGTPRNRLGESRVGRASLATGGLPGLAVANRRKAAREWLAAEPAVDRLADGIPDQVGQLAAYGNAVVPQVAEHIGRLIVAADAERAA